MNDEVPASRASRDLTRNLLAAMLIAGLIAASFWVLRPFLLATVWATMIVVATWPLMLAVQARLRSRALAVIVMTAAMLLLFVVPLALAIQALADNFDTIVGWTRSVATRGIPPPPEWLARIPLVGVRLAEAWTEIAAAGKEGLVTRLAPYTTDAVKWLAIEFGGVTATGLQVLLTGLITVILFARGDAASRGVIRFGRRLSGDRGEGIVRLAGQAIRGVALGVVVTALAQTVLAGLGLAVTGIPFAALLTAAILILCIAQIGPLPVLVPAVVWLFWNDATIRGSVLVVWTVVVGLLDNVLRPILIRRGADLPLLLIFSGVIGGLIAFGVIGLFVGPVVLAVTYTLLRQWVDETEGA